MICNLRITPAPDVISVRGHVTASSRLMQRRLTGQAARATWSPPPALRSLSGVLIGAISCGL